MAAPAPNSNPPDGQIGNRFRVAFSFAGEKRDFVSNVAAILARCFGKQAILYDKYHEAEFARHNLGLYLPKLYGEQSDLIVPVLCEKYDEKRWTGWEWLHIYGLLTKADGHRVMPGRFELANADGLSPAAAFIELDQKTPEQFAELILERLALNEGKPLDHYKNAHLNQGQNLKTSIPNNLPTLQPFFGREEELAKIADALDPESRGWGALIDGPGGMGKTSLAVRAAYDVSPDVFKRIVFVSLKRRELDDDGVRDLSGFLISGLNELFGELARVLERDDVVKAAEDQRPRLLLDALRATQTLLLLDNLESLLKKERDIIFTFVKKLPQGCKAILTSRGRIGSGAEELILQKLSEEAALATLAELATHNPHLATTSEAERLVLYRQTNGNPLLLRWTAGQIGRGHCVTFTDAIAYLRSCPEGNDPLEFIFGDLVEDFSAEETKVLCALTYFTQPAKLEHIVPIAELPEADADRALRKLTVRSLVVPSDEFKTFALVPMVADFLRNKKPEVVAETGDRLEKRAYALIVENGYSKHDRFPVLDAAWPSVAPALPRFLAGPNDPLQTVCEALWSFLEFTGRWDEWLALSQQAEAKAVMALDYIRAGARAYYAGRVHRLRGKADAVLACADRAAAHWEIARAGARERAGVLQLRGHGHQLEEDYAAAIAAHREALELFRSVSAESEDVALSLNCIANIERSSGDFAAAERNYREALRVVRTVGHAEGVASCTGNLAELALDREDWAGGEALTREALLLSEKMGRQELIASNCHRLALALVRQGKGAEGLPYARRAAEIYSRLGSHNLEHTRGLLKECEKAGGKE